GDGAAPADAAQSDASEASDKAPAPAAPAAPVTTKNACSEAALSLSADEVIAVVGGEPLKASELGDDLAQAERDALRDYCTSVAQLRRQAVDRAVEAHVLKKAAAEAGQELEPWLRSKVEAASTEPNDDDALAYYDKHKSPSAPPFEMVKDQVKAAMVDERTGEILDKLVGELKSAAKVEVTLPDIRPPALDLASTTANPSTGDLAGVVEVVEFSDFECPYCSRAADTLRGLKERYPEKVRFTFRHFPLSFHPNARPAAEHAQCAHEQGRFWQFHDLVFANQRELATDKLREYAAEAGLNANELSECLASGRAGDQVTADLAKGQEVGVGGTPSFYINGRAFAGNPTVEGLAAAIDAELAAAGS
ncbi:MAG: thioredoxin domain-containing protein, partial [Myxococcales bacterium]|nr:thioredoxin domain-containing protein [Myxococcales bacterium]